MSDSEIAKIDAEAAAKKLALQDGPVELPEPDGLPKPEHGAQVRITGVAKSAARGAAHTSIAGNTAVKAAIEGGLPDGGASPAHARKMDPEDGSVMEKRIRERGESERTPTGEDDEATAAKTAPEALKGKVQTEATVAPKPPASDPVAPPPPAPPKS